MANQNHVRSTKRPSGTRWLKSALVLGTILASIIGTREIASKEQPATAVSQTEPAVNTPAQIELNPIPLDRILSNRAPVDSSVGSNSSANLSGFTFPTRPITRSRSSR